MKPKLYLVLQSKDRIVTIVTDETQRIKTALETWNLPFKEEVLDKAVLFRLDLALTPKVKKLFRKSHNIKTGRLRDALKAAGFILWREYWLDQSTFDKVRFMDHVEVQLTPMRFKDWLESSVKPGSVAGRVYWGKDCPIFRYLKSLGVNVNAVNRKTIVFQVDDFEFSIPIPKWVEWFYYIKPDSETAWKAEPTREECLKRLKYVDDDMW